MHLIYIVVLLLAATHVSWAQSSFQVGYTFDERVRTQSDYRNNHTSIGLSNDNSAHCSYREQVFGAITPTVRFVDFSTPPLGRKVTEKQRAELVQGLLAAKVFELVSDPKPDDSVYFCSLNVQIDGRTSHVFFRTPPHSPARKAIHELMLRFASQLGADKIPASATTTTEGDRQPARKVSLADVLARPKMYHGKRISVVGFYHGEFESSSLSVDEKIRRALTLKHKERRAAGGKAGVNDGASLYKSFLKSSIWQSSPSSFANKDAISDKNDAWLRVEGVFLHGRSGHMGVWPGEIVRITRSEPVLRPQ